MKKSFRKLTAILAAAAMAITCLPLTAIAETLPQEEILVSGEKMYEDYYYVELDDGTVAITKYNGTDTEVDIPSSIKNKKVTVIASDSFRSSGVEIVNVPNGVTTIESYAFEYCSHLTEINLPDSLISIGYHAFYDCTSLVDIYPPKGLKTIGEQAFRGCSSLTEITIPGSVTTIEANTFCACSSLADVTLSDGITTIKGYAFSGCSALKAINMPDSLTTIGDYAFSGCSSLEKVKFSENLKTIEDYVFNECYSLKEITIPNSVTTIGVDAFAYCKLLTEITIPDSVIAITSYAFEYCSSLKKVTIPSSVTEIGYKVFNGCSDDFTIYGYTNSYAETYTEDNRIPFVSLGVFLSGQYSVSATADNDVISADAELDVKRTDKTDNSVAYSIMLKQSGKEIQPNGNVKLRIHIQESWSDEELQVYRKNSDGSLTNIDFDVIGNSGDCYVTFTVDKLGEFVVERVVTSIPGDVNGDEEVGELDSVMLARYLANWDVTIDKDAADLDGDGEVGETDSVILARRLAGWNV